jgi:hypothetical protein
MQHVRYSETNTINQFTNRQIQLINTAAKQIKDESNDKLITSVITRYRVQYGAK